MELQAPWRDGMEEIISTKFSMFADQLNEFTENIKTKFESRLTTLDRAGEDKRQLDV